MKHKQRSIAIALLSLMTLNSIFGTTVYAEENAEMSQLIGEINEGANVDETNVESVAESEEMTDQNTVSSDDVKSEDDTENQGIENLNYLYIEQPEQSVGDEQTIVVSWGDGSEADDVSLSVINENGENVVLDATIQNDGEYAFSYDFSQGIYHPEYLMVTNENSEEKYDLVEAGISAYFGVDETVSEDMKSEHITIEDTEETVTSEEASYEEAVTTVDESNIADTPDNIVEAMASQNVEAQVSMASLDEPELYTGAESSENVVVVLSAGHDSRFSGASGNGVKEEEATLKIARYCKEELEKYAGVTVLMVRNGASSGMGTNAIDDICKRVEWANKNKANAFISIHLNAATAAASGAEVYYLNGSSEGKALASKVQNELVGLGIYNRGVKSDEGYAVISQCKKYGITGIIVEHCFITNKSEAQKYLETEAGLKSLGVADAKGIIAYYGLSKGQWEKVGNYWFWKENKSYKTGWLNTSGYWYYLAENNTYPGGTGAMQVGWLNNCGQRYYLNASGQMLTGLQKIGGKLYYFNASGQMQKNKWVTVSGKDYYLQSDGTVAGPGWVTINEKKYLFNDSFQLVGKGWQYLNNHWYYFQSNGTMATGWLKVNGLWYYLSTTNSVAGGVGAMQTGWLTTGGQTYYMNSSGQMQTGVKNISGKKYYFDGSGAMAKDKWIITGGKQYYFSKDGSAMQNGIQSVSGKPYLFDAEGVLANAGWRTFSNHWYYINSNRTVATGWLKDGGKWYFLSPVSSVAGGIGAMQTGWVTTGGQTYYMNGSGQMLTQGWRQIAKRWYYVKADGALAKGWLKDGGKWYFLTTSGSAAGEIGAMKTGWVTTGNQKYYMNGSGQMLTGLQTVSGKKYFFNNSGSMDKNKWITSGSKQYYLSNDGSALCSGVKTIADKRYVFGDDSALVVNKWVAISGKWFYGKSDKTAATSWLKVNGIWYYMATSDSYPGGIGAMQTGWLQLGEQKYYLKSNGAMVTGYYLIDGKAYNFASDGHLLAEVHPIMGSNSADVVDKMVAYYKNSGCTYPSYYKEKKTDAQTLQTFCQIYYEEATAQGVRADVAFCQAMKETNWLRYTGDMKIEQLNFAGIGTTGGGVQGNSFSSVRIGVRAQIQHLYAYASKEDNLAYTCVDPRYQYVTKGCAQYVEWLGIQENPNHIGWAAGTGYGYQIMDMVAALNRL